MWAHVSVDFALKDGLQHRPVRKEINRSMAGTLA
jgi:hypothetical protein